MGKNKQILKALMGGRLLSQKEAHKLIFLSDIISIKYRGEKLSSFRFFKGSHGPQAVNLEKIFKELEDEENSTSKFKSKILVTVLDGREGVNSNLSEEEKNIILQSRDLTKGYNEKDLKSWSSKVTSEDGEKFDRSRLYYTNEELGNMIDFSEITPSEAEKMIESLVENNFAGGDYGN